MPNRIDVSRMLGSLDSDPFGRVAEAVALSSTDPKLRDPLNQAVAMIRERLLHNEDNPILTVEQARVFDRITPPSFGLVRIDRPAFVETLLVAIYSRATELLHATGSHAVLDDMDDLPARVEDGLNHMKSGVLGEFLIETAIGAARSHDVSHRLNMSAEAIRRRVPSLTGLEKKSQVILRQKGGSGECECVVGGCNSYGDCQAFCIDSWWECFLIVLGFIVIIILTA
jgi:hypothetical protein